MRFTKELRVDADPIWQAQLAHPFVRGIGDGSLPLEKLDFWVRQDYLFLIDYCRVFALGALWKRWRRRGAVRGADVREVGG